MVKIYLYSIAKKMSRSSLMPFQSSAVRTCGVATLMVVVVAIANIVTVEALPMFQMSLWVSVLVALAGFVIANTGTRRVAQGVALSAAAIIAVLAAVYAYKFLTTATGPSYPAGPSLNVLDAMVVWGLLTSFLVMCRSVWRDEHTAPASA